MYVVMQHTYDGGEICGVWPTAAEAAVQALGLSDVGVSVERWVAGERLGEVWVSCPGDGIYSFRAPDYEANALPANAALKAELDAAMAREAR
jgi:hypothetical protein